MESLTLDDLQLELPCPQCGQLYQLSLGVIASSQRLMHDGCPVTDERECPPEFYGPLLEPGLIGDLEVLLERLATAAQSLGGHVVARQTLDSGALRCLLGHQAGGGDIAPRDRDALARPHPAQQSR